VNQIFFLPKKHLGNRERVVPIAFTNEVRSADDRRPALQILASVQKKNQASQITSKTLNYR
jgi:hypothetical protein